MSTPDRPTLADLDWVVTGFDDDPIGDTLHHITLTGEQAHDLDDHGSLGVEYPIGPLLLDCGLLVGQVFIPGAFTRMGAPRCPDCCKITDMPPGQGSPKNDPECRKILELEPPRAD